MKWNLAVEREVKEAKAYLDQLIAKKKMVEVKHISPKRTSPQNRYLHLLINAFAAHFGYEFEEAKQIYKELTPSVYKYEKKGRVFWRSSAKISKEDMAKSIDRFRAASDEQGYPLPLATDTEWLRQLDNIIEQSKYFL